MLTAPMAPILWCICRSRMTGSIPSVSVNVPFVEVGSYTVAATCDFNVDAADTNDLPPGGARGRGRLQDDALDDPHERLRQREQHHRRRYSHKGPRMRIHVSLIRLPGARRVLRDGVCGSTGARAGAWLAQETRPAVRRLFRRALGQRLRSLHRPLQSRADRRRAGRRRGWRHRLEGRVTGQPPGRHHHRSGGGRAARRTHRPRARRRRSRLLRACAGDRTAGRPGDVGQPRDRRLVCPRSRAKAVARSRGCAATSRSRRAVAAASARSARGGPARNREASGRSSERGRKRRGIRRAMGYFAAIWHRHPLSRFSRHRANG